MAQKPIPITIEMAREQGTKDGRAGHPPSEYDGSPGKISEFEKHLASVASRQIDELVTAWHQTTNTALTEIKTLVPNLLTSVNECKRSLQAHAARFGGDARPEARHKSTKLMIAGLIFLFIVEAAVNATTFRILRETTLLTYVLGIGLSVLAPLSGFLIGRIIKSRDRTIYETAWAIASFILAAALIWVVAEGRGYAIEKKGLSPQEVNEAFWIFLLMNALLFLIAVWHGFYSSYKYPELQKRYEEFQKRKREYADRWGRLSEALNQCLGEIRQLVNEADARRISYQQANREARSDVGSAASLPTYFSNNTKLELEYPNEINTLKDAADPTRTYHDELLANPQMKSVKDAEEAIEGIDEALEGKKP